MAFNNINENLPTGNQRPGVLDDEIRQLKSDVKQALTQISSYPDLPYVILPTWTTATRPTTGIKDGIHGFNTTLNSIERYNGTTWVTLSPSAISPSYITVLPQDGTNEGGEIKLKGAGSNKDITIDNFTGKFRVYAGGGEGYQIYFDTTTGIIGGATIQNIPTSDVGGNIWIA